MFVRELYFLWCCIVVVPKLRFCCAICLFSLFWERCSCWSLLSAACFFQCCLGVWVGPGRGPLASVPWASESLAPGRGPLGPLPFPLVHGPQIPLLAWAPNFPLCMIFLSPGHPMVTSSAGQIQHSHRFVGTAVRIELGGVINLLSTMFMTRPAATGRTFPTIASARLIYIGWCLWWSRPRCSAPRRPLAACIGGLPARRRRPRSWRWCRPQLPRRPQRTRWTLSRGPTALFVLLGWRAT